MIGAIFDVEESVFSLRGELFVPERRGLKCRGEMCCLAELLSFFLS